MKITKYVPSMFKFIGDKIQQKISGKTVLFDGNHEITKPDPKMTLTDTGNNEFTEWTKSDTDNRMVVYNRTDKPGAAVAASFTGAAVSASDAVVDINQYVGTVGFSLSYWLKLDDLSAGSIWHGGAWKAPNLKFLIGTTGDDLRLAIRDTTTRQVFTNTNILTSINIFYHIVWVVNFNGGAGGVLPICYVNRVLQNTVQVGGIASFLNDSADTNFEMGDMGAADVGVDLQYFEFYGDRLLGQAEIDALYNSGVGRPTTGAETGLNFYIPFDEDTGTSNTLYHVAASNQNMSWTNSPTWVTGHVASTATTVLTPVITSVDGILPGESSINTFGDVDGRTIIEGKTIRHNINGSEIADIDSGGDWDFQGHDLYDIDTAKQNMAIFNKASGFGIQVDKTNPTFGFRDLIGDSFQRNTGATKPTFATYNGAIKVHQFSAGNEGYFTYHIRHDYVAGTEIFLHIHWSHISTLVTGGTITFKITSIYAKAHNQAPFQSSPAIGTFTGTASTTQRQQILSEVSYSDSSPSGLQLDTDLLEPDGVIELTFEMNANDMTVSSGGVPDPFIHYVDIHYQSTNLGTKSKSPNFYT